MVVWWMLAGMMVLGCMDHQLHPITAADDPGLYQATVLDFMCSRDCEWQGIATCWEQLEGHRAFCVDGAEKLDPGQVDQCLQLIAAAPAGECSYLPEECLLSSVTLSSARACAKT